MLTKHLCVLSTSELLIKLVPLSMFKPSSIFTDRSEAVLLLWIVFFYVRVSYLSLLNFVVCSLQPCDYLVGKG